MATISAALVKELRESTGAGMMDCKTALTETGGDIEAAVDWLRKKGLSKAAKKSGRVAAEGLVGVAVKDNVGVVVEVNSETDFVARNDDFQGLVRGVLAVALDKGAGVDVETVKTAHYMGGGTVNDAITNAIATIGENMTLRRASGLHVPQRRHRPLCPRPDRRRPRPHRRHCRARFDRRARAARRPRPAGRDACRRRDAARPQRRGRRSGDNREKKAVLLDKNAGKPPQVLERIVESGLKTYYKEVCLLDQPYVHDPAKTVAQAVKDAEKTVGAPIALTGFVRFALGEGVEKPAEEG